MRDILILNSTLHLFEGICDLSSLGKFDNIVNLFSFASQIQIIKVKSDLIIIADDRK